MSAAPDSVPRMDVLLIPGLWLDASSWEDVLPSVRAEGLRARPLTMPGVGRPAAESADVGISDWVDSVVAEIDRADGEVVVVGHSERRTYHHEDDALVAAKAAAAFRHGLTPIVCIGEQLEVREAGNHVEFNVNSLRGSLAGLTKEQLAGVVIAYEPVWAIGTGRVASAADAQEVCAAIRAELANLATPQIAAGVRVLYGGSVNAKNVGELIGQPDVDGGLVGGASLDGEQFAMLAALAAGGPLP